MKGKAPQLHLEGCTRPLGTSPPTRRGSAGYGVAVGMGVGVDGTANSACSSVRA